MRQRLGQVRERCCEGSGQHTGGDAEYQRTGALQQFSASRKKARFRTTFGLMVILGTIWQHHGILLLRPCWRARRSRARGLIRQQQDQTRTVRTV